MIDVYHHHKLPDISRRNINQVYSNQDLSII